MGRYKSRNARKIQLRKKKNYEIIMCKLYLGHIYIPCYTIQLIKLCLGACFIWGLFSTDISIYCKINCDEMLSSSPGYLLWARLHSPDSTGGDNCAVHADSGPVFLFVPLLWELWGWNASETEEEWRLPTRLLHGHAHRDLCLPRVSLPHLQRVFVTIHNSLYITHAC